MVYLPQSHTAAEVHAWTQEVIFVQQDVWVAEIKGQIVGYVSLENGFLTNLYVHPDHQRHGIGSALLAQVKASAPQGVKLWTFQPNEDAIRFYERHGFQTLRVYGWDRQRGARAGSADGLAVSGLVESAIPAIDTVSL
jgi:ribosomal protein S18 acetylase RimI-like enzyme